MLKIHAVLSIFMCHCFTHWCGDISVDLHGMNKHVSDKLSVIKETLQWDGTDEVLCSLFATRGCRRWWWVKQINSNWRSVLPNSCRSKELRMHEVECMKSISFRIIKNEDPAMDFWIELVFSTFCWSSGRLWSWEPPRQKNWGRQCDNTSVQVHIHSHDTHAKFSTDLLERADYKRELLNSRFPTNRW